jgi:hypothetical protein
MFDRGNLKLLFLDIDGVLNSLKGALVNGGLPHPRGKWSEDGTKLGLAEPPVFGVEFMNKDVVELLDRLLFQTNTHVVLSSSWRIGFTASECAGMLDYIGIDGRRVIGKTSSSSDGFRGGEIDAFLRSLSTKEGVDRLFELGYITPMVVGEGIVPVTYVIVDDSTDFTEQQLSLHFVNTDEYEGLTLRNIMDIAERLSPGFVVYHLGKPRNVRDENGNFMGGDSGPQRLSELDIDRI